jgi:hypothetical protein
VADAFIHICALDGMQAARAGAPILFALGISDPGTWWGELGEIGTAILERIKVNNHTFHKRFVDVAIEVAASSPAASEKAFLLRSSCALPQSNSLPSRGCSARWWGCEPGCHRTAGERERHVAVAAGLPHAHEGRPAYRSRERVFAVAGPHQRRAAEGDAVCRKRELLRSVVPPPGLGRGLQPVLLR